MYGYDSCSKTRIGRFIHKHSSSTNPYLDDVPRIQTRLVISRRNCLKFLLCSLIGVVHPWLLLRKEATIGTFRLYVHDPLWFPLLRSSFMATIFQYVCRILLPSCDFLIIVLVIAIISTPTLKARWIWISGLVEWVVGTNSTLLPRIFFRRPWLSAK